MWKKRKRESQSNRRLKHDQEDDADEDDDEIDGEDEIPVQDHHVPVDIPPSDCEREVLLDGGDRISSFPLAVRRTVTRTHSSVKAMAALEWTLQRGDAKKQQQTDVVLENISYGQVQAFSAVPADGGSSQTSDPDRSDGCGASTVLLSPPPIMEGRGVQKRMGKRLHVLPVHAEWFSETSVHRLERQVVPHFFSGRSTEHTPEKYMNLRNWIVGRYMEDKGRRLGISDFQGADTGVDWDDLVRIFRFLDHWGIINYCASDTCREPWSMETYLREDFNWELHVPSASLRSIDSLIHFDKPKCRLKPSDMYTYPTHGVDISDIDDKIREKLSENRCSHCSRPIPVVYYQSQKEVDTLLCLDCFGEGRLVLGHSSLDFVKTETTQEHDDIYGENWTDQETLLLLEAMEIYSDNWNEIAEHVGTKSKPQCILHFIRMPMEGGFFENIHLPVVPTTTTEDPVKIKDFAGSLHRQDSESRIPFENSGNPVMYLVAFLASVVGPRVAAACAHASLVVLSEQEELASHQNTKDVSDIGNRFLNGESKGPSPSPEKVKAAAKAGLSAAGMKAKLFSDHEEREIQRLSANIVNNQLKRVELKLKRFNDVETLLLKESEQVEKARLRFSAERLHILSTRFGQPGFGQPGFGIPGTAPVLLNMGGARQAGVGLPGPQPGITGTAGNSWPSYDRQIPPQMPMPLRHHHHHHHHHQMFAGGQRIPLNTVNSPPPMSSASPAGIPLRPVSTTTLGLT